MSLPSNPSQSLSRAASARPLVCYVTDRTSLPASNQEARLPLLLQKIEALSAAGLDWIQIREKDLSGNACAALVRDATRRIAHAAASPNSKARLLVNDRLDVALAEKAGGVHLGEQSLPVAEARRLLLAHTKTGVAPPDFLIGASCHSLDAAKAAAADGADYIFFGPVFTSPSKAAYGPPQGIERLREVCSCVAIPVLAIGGITIENASNCFAAGASGIAAIRLFQDAADAASLVHFLQSGEKLGR